MKSTGSCGFGHIYKSVWKTSFFVQCQIPMIQKLENQAIKEAYSELTRTFKMELLAQNEAV